MPFGYVSRCSDASKKNAALSVSEDENIPMKLPLCMFGIILLAFGLSGPSPAVEGDAVFKVADRHVDFLTGEGKELVGRYHFAPDLPKPHFHPLNGPFGKPVTRGFPVIKDDPTETKDHPHQRMVWFCHGDVIPEGLELKSKVKGVTGVDFWAESPGHGRIVCKKAESFTPARPGPFQTVNLWLSGDGDPILEESRAIELHDLGPAKLFVFDITLFATQWPITFGDTKEGSFGVRVAETMTEKKGGVLENADGKRTMKECWGQTSAWCDYSGLVDGKTVGVAIFDDPKNPHPAFWHSRDYGLMAANPFGRSKSGFPAAKGRTDLVKLAKGERLKLRYGLLVHPGDAKEGKVAEHYQAFLKLK